MLQGHHASHTSGNAQELSRTPHDQESERVLDRFLSEAPFEAGLYCRADDRGDPVIQLAPPLISGQEVFDEAEQILRSVLTEAWTTS